MNDVQQRAAAKHFAEYWKGKGYEKGESQKFWLASLGDVFGVEHATEYISFEDQVHLDHTSFIDGYIPETHVLIEQKSIDKDLKKPIKQSDGTLLTPRQQAQRYIHALLDEKGRDAVPKLFSVVFHKQNGCCVTDSYWSNKPQPDIILPGPS